MLATVAFVLFMSFGTGAGNPCMQDWMLYGNSCYGFGEAFVTWGDAEEMCRVSGAKLAEIETTEENSYLKAQAKNKNGENYWIGGTDVFHEGNWIWMSTGETIYPFSDWHQSSGQPDDQYGNEDCLVIRQLYSYQWNDWPCEMRFNFICELELGETVVG